MSVLVYRLPFWRQDLFNPTHPRLVAACLLYLRSEKSASHMKRVGGETSTPFRCLSVQHFGARAFAFAYLFAVVLYIRASGETTDSDSRDKW